MQPTAVFQKTYVIEEKTVVIKERQAAGPRALGPIGQSAAIDVHGRVVNEKGEPIPGVNISLKGGKVIGVTNDNGEFALINVAPNAVLVFTAVTILTYEVKLDGRNELALTATTKISQLEDVVVSKGYYSVRQKENTGNVVTVSGEDIRRQPTGNPILALEGKVAGLFIAQGVGLPGSSQTIRLRGQNSIANGNDPLIIIDGIPFTSTALSNPFTSRITSISPFNAVNPNDIESIEVLKDADATAIYGSRGANGVILITTKKGKGSQTNVDVNVYAGGGKVAHFMDLMNTQQYLQMRREAFANDGKTPSGTVAAVSPFVYAPDILVWDTTKSTNWQKQFMGGTANIFDAQASVSGGTDNTRFLISGSHHRESTVVPGNFSDLRTAGHFSLSHQSANKKFHLNLSCNYTKGISQLPADGSFVSSILLAPDVPSFFDANGNLDWTWTNSVGGNPYAVLQKYNRTQIDNLSANLGAGYMIVSGLELKLSGGYSKYSSEEISQVPLSSYPPSVTNTNLRENRTANNYLETWNMEPVLSYSKTINRHRFSVLVGTTFLESKRNSIGLVARGFSSDDLIGNVANASTFVTNFSYAKYNYNAFFGRAGYDFDQKYLLNITARRDGSSRYGPESRFGNFGAIGAGWVFSKERFVEKLLPFLSFGKIRTSYGSTGNDQIGDYVYMSTYSIILPTRDKRD